MGFLKKAEKNFKHPFDRRSPSGEVQSQSAKACAASPSMIGLHSVTSDEDEILSYQLTLLFCHPEPIDLVTPVQL